MATAHRTPDPAVIEALLARPHDADLFQAIALLESARADAVALGTGRWRDEALRLCGQVCLAFAPSDITAVEATATHWELRSPVMALAGANAPLPLPYAEGLLGAQYRRDPAPLAFLDIFHHRWMTLLYRNRKQHRVSLQWSAPQDSPLAAALDAIAGLGLRRGAPGPDGARNWLRHAALFGPAPRSMERLEALLRDRLRLAVRGEPLVGGWLRLGGRGSLGRARLGRDSALLGRRAWDAAAGIRLHVGPVPAPRWAAFLPGGRALEALRWLCAHHAQRDLQLQVQLQPAADMRGGGPHLGRSRLGWDSWLGGRRLSPVRLRLGSGAEHA